TAPGDRAAARRRRPRLDRGRRSGQDSRGQALGRLLPGPRCSQAGAAARLAVLSALPRRHPWPKEATDDEARAARIVRQSFQPHLPFLDWMLAIIRGLEFTARQLPGSSDQAPVSAIALPKAAR